MPRRGLLGGCPGASAQVSGRHEHRRQHMDQLGSGRAATRTATRTATRLTRWLGSRDGVQGSGAGWDRDSSVALEPADGP